MNTRIRKAREAAGLTQKALADAIGVSDRQVSRWESGESEISASKLVQLAKAVNTTASDIIGENDTETTHWEDFRGDMYEALTRKITLPLADWQRLEREAKLNNVSISDLIFRFSNLALKNIPRGKHMFAVVDDHGTDIFTDFFDNLEEANAQAERDWSRVSAYERKRGERKIYVVDSYTEIDENGNTTEVDQYFFDENGNPIDTGEMNIYQSSSEGYFDSRKENR